MNRWQRGVPQVLNIFETAQRAGGGVADEDADRDGFPGGDEAGNLTFDGESRAKKWCGDQRQSRQGCQEQESLHG